METERIEYEDGIEYRKMGRLHREDGPALIRFDGHKAWCIEGVPHRENGPAIEYADGNFTWYLHGKVHRLDGPAAMTAGYDDWYVNGYRITDGIKDWADDRNIDLDNLTEEDKYAIALEWSNYNG